MKKNNKGFSLVELIIVIAIMAILAGALAPALIKYINKSRRSTDISNADTIRSAIQTAMSNESAADEIASAGEFTIEFNGTSRTYSIDTPSTFDSELVSILGSGTSLNTKYYTGTGKTFVATVSMTNNTVTVKNAAGLELSPNTPSDD